jgi:hypothetical protein
VRAITRTGVLLQAAHADRVRSGYLKSTTPGVPSRIVTVTVLTSPESIREMALSPYVPQGHS